MPGDAVTLAISGPSLWGCSMVGMWEHHILIAKQNRLTLSFLSITGQGLHHRPGYKCNLQKGS